MYPFWLRFSLLSSLMLLSATLWIRGFSGKSVKSWLGLDGTSVTVLTSLVLAAILFLFLSEPFEEAMLLMGSALLIPLVEELFFRSFLLGSMVGEWPDLRDVPRRERLTLLKLSFLPLFATSLSFMLVHDDVIHILMSFPLIDSTSLIILFLRLVFGMAVGGLYLLKRTWSVPAAFHILFNLSYFLVRR